ncbi:hypothetical protein [Desulfosporosinus hippei]|uniref:Uncharacterized protein n=1 Tax=Desulfosporosinus hippei DSM 8344 TaxID=1121419 RepID=A0A1G8G0A8_9FIRM|nr:hypothetical protein [Desulfosporosinus hippei]SDH87666.1 hypothetical protein SAMN05443529_12110 [Desulfosporosinus hippei DSM 8344]
MHGEAVKPTSLPGEAEPRVHTRYYPEVLARKCPVDIFAEAAISKEYLSAEDSSQVSAWASLGVLIDTKTLSSHELAGLAGCGRSRPARAPQF